MGKLDGLAQPMGELYGLAGRELPRICTVDGSVQQDLPQKEPTEFNDTPPSIEQPRTAQTPPEKASSSSLPLSTDEQPRAAGAPPERVSYSLPQSSSPAQREIPIRKSLLLPSNGQPRGAGALLERMSSSLRYLNRAAPRSGRSPRKTERAPSFPLYRAAPCSGSTPRKGLLPTSIEQPHAAGDP